MNKKPGRNDPCSCGSGKKYKNCCFAKDSIPASQRKITAKWLNMPTKEQEMSPEAKLEDELINRAYGEAVRDTSFHKQTTSDGD